MDVHSFAEARQSRPALRAQIGRLIEVVGTPRFEAELFEVARSAINCEHLTAYANSGAGAPRILLAANSGALPIAKPIAEKYAGHYWRLDPANRTQEFFRKNASIAIRVLPDQDIDDEPYRHDCYTSVRIMDRFTIIQRSGPDVYRIHFLTGGHYGCFAQTDIDNIMDCADLLMSLLIKHDASRASAGDKDAERQFRDRLRLVAPAMPEREVEVCTAIMLGLTSEAIALKLGISVNTVLTYRKRAYERLQISCQNELMRLVLL